MFIFVEGGKPDNPEKNPWCKDENQQQTQPAYDAGSGNRTRDTLVGGERSHHCATPALIDHEFRHNIVKVAVDPRGDSRVDPQTTLTML